MLSSDVADISTSILARLDQLCPGLVTGFVVRGAAGGGEYCCGDHFEFTGLCARHPVGDDVVGLVQAHSEFRDGEGVPPRVELSGFYVQPQVLAKSSALSGPLPTFVDGAFDDRSAVKVSPWVWAQHKSAAVAVRGELPEIGLDGGELSDFCRSQLGGFWRQRLAGVAQLGVDRVGVSDGSVAWMVLGAAAVRVALDSGVVLPPSAAGRHILDRWDTAWHPVVVAALVAREGKTGVSLADVAAAQVLGSEEFLALSEPAIRGQAVVDFVELCCSID